MIEQNAAKNILFFLVPKKRFFFFFPRRTFQRLSTTRKEGESYIRVSLYQFPVIIRRKCQQNRTEMSDALMRNVVLMLNQ
jgi:hypothetical protein